MIKAIEKEKEDEVDEIKVEPEENKRIQILKRNNGFVILSFDHDNKLSCVKRLLNKPRLCIFTFNISDWISFNIDDVVHYLKKNEKILNLLINKFKD